MHFGCLRRYQIVYNQFVKRRISLCPIQALLLFIPHQFHSTFFECHESSGHKFQHTDGRYYNWHVHSRAWNSHFDIPEYQINIPFYDPAIHVICNGDWFYHQLTYTKDISYSLQYGWNNIYSSIFPIDDTSYSNQFCPSYSSEKYSTWYQFNKESYCI